jgi:hypothetical protein
VTPVQFGGVEHRCLLLRPPLGGEIELSVSGRDYFRLLSMIQVSSTDGKRVSVLSRAGVRVTVDGREIETAFRGKQVRSPLPAPRESLSIVVDGIVEQDLCLYFSVTAWAARTLDPEPDAHVHAP